MNLELSDLDLTNIARWPAAARAVVILFIMGGVIGTIALAMLLPIFRLSSSH